jgi:hypothetical protein
MLTLPASATVVDRVVVVVDEELVMLSEVQLEEALSTLDVTNSPFWSANHNTAVDRLIDAAVVRQVAGEVRLYEPPEKSVRNRVELIRRRFGGRLPWLEFLERWGLDEAQLRIIVRRRMVVERFLDRNLSVSTDEQQAWLTASDEFMKQLRLRLRIRHTETQH